MITKPTLIVHTTYFSVETSGPIRDPERPGAETLGKELYETLTRPKNDPLAWGPGIPVRVATRHDQVDCDEAQHVVIIPVLNHASFTDERTRELAVTTINDWRTRARVYPVLVARQWRDKESMIPKPLLTEPDRLATINELLLSLARVLSNKEQRASRIFISHAKVDLEATGRAAEAIHSYVTRQTSGSGFFDRVSITAGEDLGSQIDDALGNGVFVAVRGDLYSSRLWCRRELLEAKKRGLPTLVVEVLSTGEARSATYFGNGTTVVWDRSGGDLAAARVVNVAMAENVRHLYFQEEIKRVLSAVGLPSSAECLSRPPELLDLARVRRRLDATIVIAHPDPPLPEFERELLQDADKRVRLITPTTAFANAIGSSIRAPLDGWQVGLSLANSPDAPESGGVDGTTSLHITDVATYVARALIGVGAAIAYGGDLRKKDGYTRHLAELVVNYNATARRGGEYLHSYLRASIDPNDGNDLLYTMHSMRTHELALLAPPGDDEEPTAARRALYLSDMRRVMSLRTRAWVVLGGKTKPVSSGGDGYSGRYPGVVEEAWRALSAQPSLPLYVAGGFGGAAKLIVQALEQRPTPSVMKDATFAGNQSWSDLIDSWKADPDTDRLALPESLEDLYSEIANLGAKHLASEEASVAWNGLTLAENRRLFHTKDPLTLVSLVMKGLITSSARRAQGKLRVELVEGSVTSAADLEVLVFPTFRDLELDGAGAAIDRASGGAATRAHRTGVATPSESSSLGAKFVYAADIGPANSVLSDVRTHVETAASAVAEMIQRHGFQRVGVVTFLGNVAENMSDTIRAMVAGLLKAADTAEIVWFERYPTRAAVIAKVLGDNDRVVLTRRTAALQEAANNVTVRARNFINVTHADGQLDVGLLFHRGNGLAPLVRSPLDLAERRELAGNPHDRAPEEADLRKRGAKMLELLFGDKSSRVLDDVEGSELVVMHTAEASALPYEALVWEVDGRVVTPATAGGLVRRLVSDGVPPERALPRPPRVGMLGVLVVINPTEDLPGAEREGKALVEELRKGSFHLTVLRGRDATVAKILDALADPTIDVFHYCGHAFFDDVGADDSGLDCHDGRLTLAKLKNLTVVPRLAFVNACESGRLVRGAALTMREPQAFAEFFLRTGVDAYLGAFWLVSDNGAAEFAATVYRELANGEELGAAVVKGRKALQDAKNCDWANYALYGHTGFRLLQADTNDQPAQPSPPPPSFRVDGSTIVASWTFPATAAPTAFSVAAMDLATDEPLELACPIVIDRRDLTSDGPSVVTWIATISLAADASAPIELRPSDGLPIEVRTTTAVAARGMQSVARPAMARSRRDELRRLRAILDQQPDGGRAVLRALQRSADPEELRARVDAELGSDLPDRKRAIWPISSLLTPKVEPAALQRFIDAYEVPPLLPETAESTQFQTKEDWQSYMFAPGAIDFTVGYELNAPMWKGLPDPITAMTHDVRDGEFVDDEIQLALFSDNANGLHSSLAIAQQLVDSDLPYAFHLGDVYYGGTQREVADYFEQPLRPMFDRTELFMVSGNHEMFSKGDWFQDLIRRKAKDHPDRQRQQGEMFRLRGKGFQVIGVDTMYVDHNVRKLRLHDRADDAVLQVVDAWLKDRPNDLTILMTTNEPWDKGSTRMTPLYESLRTTIAGRVDLWFWGNVHYAALYEPWDFNDVGSSRRNIVGSCIGHGGYPFYTQKPLGPDVQLPHRVKCRWLETKSRFWPDKTLRPDVGANGWCRLKLKREATQWRVHLGFVDWTRRERLRAELIRPDGGSITFGEVTESEQTEVGGPTSWHAVAVPK